MATKPTAVRYAGARESSDSSSATPMVRAPTTAPGMLPSAVRRTAGLTGLRDALLIRLHGLRLWRRGLAIRPRPVHHQEGVS